jgi:hypothetical protein
MPVPSLHFRDARQIGIMNRVDKAERFLAKPRQRPVAARSLSRHKDDPGRPFSASFSAATSPMPEVPPVTTTVFPFMNTLPLHMAPLGPGSVGFRSCTLICIVDEKRERNCIALKR